MTRSPLLAVLGATVTLAGCAPSAPGRPAPPAPAPAQTAAATITAADFYARVSFLASDALRGRGTPSQGLNAAAAYLASEYTRLGVDPAGENGSFYQWYPFPLLGLDTASVHFGTVAGGQNEMLEYGADFFVAPAAAAEPGRMNHARLLYVGELDDAGLPAAEYGGAAPVVTIPGAYSRDWRITAARARRAAQEAGATALIVVASPEFPARAFETLTAQSRVFRRQLPAQGQIPVIYLSHPAAARVAARAGRDLDELGARPEAPIPFDDLEAHFAAEAVQADAAMAPNIVAMIPGSDPDLRDEYVVLSAHMDHVGVGTPVNGDSIYNGADDDASGTSALVEIAEALVSLPAAPRRSIVFLHVSGEEHGLLGSLWYSENPTLPLEQVVANINIDMIGRNSPDSVVVIGKDYSSLGRVVEAAGRRHRDHGLVVSDDIWPEERFFFRSDHFNFARKEIPALFFFTGVHEDYHQPSDEVEKLDVDKAARVARLVFHTVRAIADDPERPTWTPEGLAEVRALTR